MGGAETLAAILGRGRTSFRELLDQARRFATVLDGCSIGRGDKVALLLGNCAAFPAAHYAIGRLGAVAVPINPSLRGTVLRHILVKSEARALLTSPALAEALRVAGELPEAPVETLVLDGHGVPGSPLLVARLGAAAPAEAQWRKICDVAPRAGAPAAGPDDDAAILFTSGTTGRPKGVLLSHRAALIGLDFWADRWNFAPDTVSLMVAPFFHVVYHPLVLGAHRRGGATVVLERFSVRAAFQLAERERATALMGNPSVFQQFLGDGLSRSRDLRALCTVIYGAAPTPAPLVRQIQEALPHAGLYNCYGLSETSSAVSCLGPEDSATRPKSVGRPHPGVAISIRDEAGAAQPAGAVGEICVRGPNLMRGYYKEPQETARRLRDGWLRTGDLGYLDADGYLHILDRADDLIIVTGEKIYPREVEDVLYGHPDVADAAVYGVEHESRGQVVKALVVLRGGAQADEMALRRYCVERMAAVCVPRIIEFTATLPRNPAGKILRRELR